MNNKPKSKRGFASMSLERRREIASRGGLSVNPANRSFSKDRKLASAAAKRRRKKAPADAGV